MRDATGSKCCIGTVMRRARLWDDVMRDLFGAINDARPGPILKSLQKRHDVGQRTVWLPTRRNRLKLRKNVAFHCEIGFEITMSGGNLLVTQPQCDDLQGNAGLEQVHGGCMSVMSLKT